MISFLLSHGADADAEDAAGRSGACAAARTASSSEFPARAMRCADAPARRFPRAALHVAALSGALGAAEALLAAGAWVDAQDGGDATPLLHAARSGGGALVRVLLRAGGSHATRDARGLSPLAHAVANDAPEAAQALLAAGADASESPRDASLLHLAAATGAVRCARLLLARPGGSAALRDTRNAMRWTPLHAAAAAARPALVELLLGWREGGTVDVDARSADGKTALDCCACAPPEAADAAAECERLLLARGARRGSAIATASSPPAAATARRGDPARAAAEAFAALSRDAQSARLDRWADAAAAPGASDAPPPDFPGPGAVAFSHVAAAGVLRLDAALDDVTARMLDDDDWQDLMASPAVRAAVEEVQADANAVRKWGENAACMAALGELRKLQAFCKPKGLRTSLPALLRRADNTADGARERMRRCVAAVCSKAHGACADVVLVLTRLLVQQEAGRGAQCAGDGARCHPGACARRSTARRRGIAATDADACSSAAER